MKTVQPNISQSNKKTPNNKRRHPEKSKKKILKKLFHQKKLQKL
jgi:hypothetical protein